MRDSLYKQRGVPQFDNLCQKWIIDWLNRDVYFGDRLMFNCPGTKEFKERRLELANLAGVFYHRQFDPKSRRIRVITFYRVIDTWNMYYFLPLTFSEEVFIRGELNLRLDVKLNFCLVEDKKMKRYAIPSQYI